MNEPIDTFEHAGLEVRVRYEEYVDENDNPRTNCDGNVGVMFCEHPDYTLGDSDAEDPRGHECPDCEGDGTKDGEGLEDCPRCGGNGELSLVAYLRDVKKARVALPLFLYDHSGITMRCGANLLTGDDNLVSRNRFVGDGAGWDTSTVGVIYFDPELAERWGRPETSDEQIEKELDEEVKYYAAYLEGRVFGYEVIAPDGDVLDSCWGFLEPDYYGQDNSEASVVQEAKMAAEACRREIEREKIEAHRWACADVVTV